MYKCIYFHIKELVSPVVYDYYTKLYGKTGGENLMWSFFNEEDLQDLDTIRESWCSAIIINNWATGDQYKESGLRCNVDSLTKAKNTPYCGGHNLGKGFDLKDKLGRNSKLHAHVCNLIKHKKLKSMKRVENLKSTPTWTHTDSFQTADNGLQIF